MPLHFVRQFNLYASRPTILVLGNHPAFAWLFHQQILQHHYAWREQTNAWEIDSEAEGMLWWIVADTVGLSDVCVNCLAGQCPAAQAILSFQHLQATVMAHVRAFAARAAAAASQPKLSTETALGRYNPERSRDLPTLERAVEILRIQWPATRSTVLKAFKKRTLESHPDRKLGGSDAAMREVLAAREALLELL